MVATNAPPLDLHADAEPATVGLLRKQLRRWLLESVDDLDTIDDLVLAASEAIENVVDHAFVDASGPGTVTLSAHRDAGLITITVADNGHWQPRDAGNGPQTRGRGLSLIGQLTESNDVTTGPSGTTVTLHQSC